MRRAGRRWVTCGATVKGNVDYGASGAPVMIGSPAAGCAGNVVTGQMLINLSNAPVEVFGNQIGQQLECTLNASITGGGNTARQKLGQCSTF